MINLVIIMKSINNKTMNMKMKYISYSLCLFVSALCLLSCGASRNVEDADDRIIIKGESYNDNYTNPQFKEYIKKLRENGGTPTIIIRGSGQTGSISSITSNDKIYSILETALSKNEFDVRDRSIFETVANSATKGGTESISYKDLSIATGVELLMEVSHYSISDYYYVDGYYDSRKAFHKFERQNIGTKDEPQWISPTYIFRGMSISLKIIMLKDNLVGGSYSYSYIPCSEESGGAKIVQMYPLRYRAETEARDIDAILDDGRNTSLLESRSQRLDRAMERFLSNVVVPGLMDDIEGVSRDNASAFDNQGYPFINAESRGSHSSFGYQTVNRNERETISNLPQAAEPSKKENEQVKRTDESSKKENKLVKRIKELANKEAESSKEEPVRQVSTPIVVNNSAGKMTEAVAGMIEKKFVAQVNEELNKLKSQKKKDALLEMTSSITTPLQRWQYLSEDAISELNSFILAITRTVGMRKPMAEINQFSFYLSSREDVDDETVLLLFMDGQCVGIGSDSKGFYSCLEKEGYASHISQLVIMAVREGNKEKKELFKSEISVDLRNDYEFERDLHRDIIRALVLK